MPKIIVSKSGEAVKVVNSVSESIVLGRIMGCDVCIEDVDIALKQLVIHAENDSFYVTPLSHNPPVEISGKSVDGETPIKDGEEISVGEYIVTFRAEADPEFIASLESEAEEDLTASDIVREVPTIEEISRLPGVTIERDDDPIVIGASSEDRFKPPTREFRSPDELARDLGLGADDSSDSADGASAQYMLLTLVGPYEGEAYAIKEGRNVIGRQAGCDILIANDDRGRHDKSISRTHAEIVIESGRMTLTAFRSKYGTWINGNILREGTSTVLEESDEIKIESGRASSIFRLVRKDRADISPPSHFMPDEEKHGGFPSWIIVLAVSILLLIIVTLVLSR